MSIDATDPFALLAVQSGLVNTPLSESGAGGSTALDVKQRSITIGEVVPIVFGRRVGTDGGVLVAPGATEARFINDASNTLTASYHLVVSEGQIDALLIKDVFQRACRIGTWAQSYNQRAGTWTLGNFVTTQTGYTKPECPYYCGTSGTYAGLSTLSFTNSYANGETRWDRQIFAFVRGGMYVTRLIDGVTGPSNNVADLAYYLIQKSSRVSSEKIDTTALTAAGNFTQNAGFWFNGIVQTSSNLEDWLAKVAPNFLLRVSDKAGAKGLRPLLPVDSSNNIKTGAIYASITFSEDHITPDGFSISYISAAERMPICAQVLWRQQPDDDQGIIRTTEVRFTGEAPNGPYEQYDLSEYCATENHAVKVGAFRIARRKYITHTLQLTLQPGAAPSTLAVGDVVRVYLQRAASLGTDSTHDYLYEVNQIGRSLSGLVTLDLVHFPVDGASRSLVAIAVSSATGAGYTLATGKSGVSCDTNSSTATTTVPSSGGNLSSLPAANNFQQDVPIPPVQPGISLSKGSGNTSSNPQVGDTLTAPTICAGGTVTWYRLDPSAPDGRVQVQAPSSGLPYIMVINDKDYSVYCDISCPGSSAPYSAPPVGPVTAADSLEFSVGAGTYSATWVKRVVYGNTYNCNGSLRDTGYTSTANGGVDTLTYGSPQTVYGIKVAYAGAKHAEVSCANGTSTYTNSSNQLIVYTQNTSGGAWTQRSVSQCDEGIAYAAGRVQSIDTTIDTIVIKKGQTQLYP